MKNISIILFFLAAMLWAEEEHVLNVGGALYVPLVIDEVASDIPRVGAIGMLDLGYRYLGRGQSHALRLLMGGGALFPQYVDTGYHEWDQGQSSEELIGGVRLDLRSTFQVYSHDAIFVRLGAYVLGAFEAFATSHFFSVTWVGEAGIGIAGELLFRVDRHSFEFIVTLPLGALLSRPRWSIYLVEDEITLDQEGIAPLLFERAIVTSLHEYLRIELTGIYSYRLNKRISLVAQYEFLYRSLRIPRTSLSFGHLFSFNVHVHFPGKSI